MRVAALEELLESWFESPVVLTSSGRGAMLLQFQEWNLNRYRDRVALPRFISGCVMDAVVRVAFPIEAADARPASAHVLYHQYGFPQRRSLDGNRVLEDICHAFFARADSGARLWMGDAAVFSLPKFIATSSMVGGLVVRNPNTAVRLRARRDSCRAAHLFSPHQMAETFRAEYHRGGVALEELYIARLLDPRVWDEELCGLPTGRNVLSEIGAQRQEVVRQMLDATGGADLPTDWVEFLHGGVPFLFPVAGSQSKLIRAAADLQSAGVSADIYSVDLARDMLAPEYKRLLLVPCHHEMSDSSLNYTLSVLRSVKD